MFYGDSLCAGGQTFCEKASRSLPVERTGPHPTVGFKLVKRAASFIGRYVGGVGLDGTGSA